MGETNLAAWQLAPGQPLHIGAARVPELADDEILIRNAAVAINPLDWLLQDAAILPWLDYPAILGSDVAGKIVGVGRQVARFQVGDRVLGQAVGTTVNNAGQGAFQHHTVVFEHMAAPIPDDLAFTDAAVLPLGIGTAAVGLYGKANLGLRYPSMPPSPKADVVLVWGGSSSVGCNAIQLADNSGYECLTVASLKNADMLKRLGASTVIDRADPNIVETVVAAIGGRRLAGTLHATGDMAACFAAVAKCQGSHHVAATLPPPATFSSAVKVTHILGTSLKDDEIGPMIYRDFLPRALATGTFVTAPRATIVGNGLEAFQEALDTLKAGVSGAKVVVTLC